MRCGWKAIALALLLTPACRRDETSGVAVAPATPSAAREAAGRTPRRGGTLARRLVGEPGTLNAILQTGLPEQQVLQGISRNLFDFDSRLNLVPALAQAMEASSDGLVFTVTLRPEAAWEDGRPVTARDAVYTIRRIADPGVPAPVFKPLFESLESVEAVDQKTFRVRFREPYAYRAFSFVLPLLPAHRYEARDLLRAVENRAPISNGPYRFGVWRPSESITLERNSRYWGAVPHFDRVLFRILPENSVSYDSLVAGQLDETLIDSSLKQRAASDPRFRSCCRVLEFYNLNYNYIALNHRTPFFADARVRRAVTMLLDRQTLVRTLYGGSARVISGPWAPDSPAYDARVLPLPYDPSGAATLLEQAGWRDSDGDGLRDRAGVPFRFELLVSAGSTIGRQIDEILAAELSRVGVSAQVRTMEWAAFVERLDSGQFESASLAWSASDPNPDPYPYWHSSQWPPHGFNSGYYRNPSADRLMEEARVETDQARRLGLYHRLHLLLRDDAPAVFVVNASEKYALRSRLRGVSPSALGLFGAWPGPVGWWTGEEDRPERGRTGLPR